MLRPMCGVEQGILNAGSGQATDRSYGMHFIELQQLEMKSTNKDPRWHSHPRSARLFKAY